jgi:DNA polymerase III subunit gamma/tau
MSDARADPDVAAILARFPGSRIIDVKILGEPALSETAAEETVVIENAAPDDEIDDN